MRRRKLHHGISRRQIAPKMVFVSHETYTPARGGSASAEIHALRHVFGDAADQIVIANTKGFTGHAMATGIEDVVAVKALETGCVPPVANFKEVDPELGPLNLSKGGTYPVEYALRLAAGFGSQISLTLLRWVATKDGVHPSQNALGYTYRVADPEAWKAWLSAIAGHPAADLEVVQRTLRVYDPRVPVSGARSSPTSSQPRARSPGAAKQTGCRPTGSKAAPWRHRRESVCATLRSIGFRAAHPGSCRRAGQRTKAHGGGNRGEKDHPQGARTRP